MYAALVLSRDRPGELRHTLVKLDATAAPGSRESYLVDPWLRPHAVWHDDSGPHFDGPAEAPRAG